MRLIDADALNERMYHDAFETDSDMQKWDSGCWIRYKLFEQAIEDAPTIEPEQRWIPVSETVDVPEHEVLACDKYGTELIGFICEKDEQWMCESDECIIYDVVAYMPLPEPYKGDAG